ncbi:hypothetical protein H2199_005587 [Coniosporium tulheliwenetii]|uniref:Uncharacterized protein n=1 Tax=Coniosporium tulheliwenetii TaxID=3383036 RepID=A0ACC2Z0P3_9PEZI|nr:hypothetical protein H2199_005587 [Cladosporium sp. JES 115]
MSEDQSGINWKYANQGLSLLTDAYHESSSLSRNHENGQATFSRQLYMHGLTYLLRGLPNNMTAEESLSIRFALPSGVAETPLLDPTTGALIPAYTTLTASQPQSQHPEPSLLHRILASSIIHLFLLVHLVLPYIKLFLGHAYRYEREHRISERVFSTSVNAVDEVGKRSLALTQTVCAMNDGKVGQMMNDAAVWWVRSLTGDT